LLTVVRVLEQATPFSFDQIIRSQSGLLQDTGCHPAASLSEAVIAKRLAWHNSTIENAVDEWRDHL